MTPNHPDNYRLSHPTLTPFVLPRTLLKIYNQKESKTGIKSGQHNICMLNPAFAILSARYSIFMAELLRMWNDIAGTATHAPVTYYCYKIWPGEQIKSQEYKLKKHFLCNVPTTETFFPKMVLKACCLYKQMNVHLSVSWPSRLSISMILICLHRICNKYPFVIGYRCVGEKYEISNISPSYLYPHKQSIVKQRVKMIFQQWNISLLSWPRQ